jgi:transposase
VVHRPHKGRPAKLTEKAKADLQTQLDDSRVETLKQACGFVAQNHGIVLTQAAMHYYFKREKIKKKTGCPANVRKDEQSEPAFKKSLSPLKQRYGEAIYFKDELRSGTRTQCKTRWTP